MHYTYRQLREELLKLTDDQLDVDVTIFDSNEDEFYPVHRLTFNSFKDSAGTDVLDEDHPYLIK